MSDKTPWRIAVRGELTLWIQVTLLWLYVGVRDHSSAAYFAAAGAFFCTLVEVNSTLYRRNHPTQKHAPCGCPLCRAVGDA